MTVTPLKTARAQGAASTASVGCVLGHHLPVIAETLRTYVSRSVLVDLGELFGGFQKTSVGRLGRCRAVLTGEGH